MLLILGKHRNARVSSQMNGVLCDLLLFNIPFTLQSAILNHTCMAAPRILRRFPFNLGLGTDICHVVRIESILNSSRGIRFVRKILSPDERNHPKICWLLSPHSQSALSSQDGQSRLTGSGLCTNESKVEETHGDRSSAQDIQMAAKFVAGRYAVS